MSTAPRPYRNPSLTSPENAPWVHAPSSPGGTTSVWPAEGDYAGAPLPMRGVKIVDIGGARFAEGDAVHFEAGALQDIFEYAKRAGVGRGSPKGSAADRGRWRGASVMPPLNMRAGPWASTGTRNCRALRRRARDRAMLIFPLASGSDPNRFRSLGALETEYLDKAPDAQPKSEAADDKHRGLIVEPVG